MRDRLDKRLNFKAQDPYLDKTQYKDPTICPKCSLVYHNKTWKKDENLKKQLIKTNKVEFKECPACRKIKDNYPLGIIHLSGEYILDEFHKNEILNLVKHEAEKEENTNPLSRIMSIEHDKNDYLIIKTTTEGLAARIGKAIQRAHKGNLEFKFSDDQKLLRVFWEK